MDEERPIDGGGDEQQQQQQPPPVVEKMTKLSIEPTDDESSATKVVKYLAEDIEVFIMSEAGKMIYCYTEREDAITLMGVCVALVNFVLKTQNDILRSIKTRNGLHINFAVRSPLVIVVVARQHSCFDVGTLINQINAQIITTITLKSLKSVFQQAPTYDLKRLIHSNELKTMDILVESISTPIADMFTTYKNRRHRAVSGHQSPQYVFDNVISFYTSTTIALPRTSTTTTSNGTQGGGANNQSMAITTLAKPNVLSRVYVPIAIIPSNIRDQMTSIVNGAVTNFKDIVFSILFQIEKSETIGMAMANGQSAPPTIPNSYSSSRTMTTTTDDSEEDFIDALDDLSNSGGCTSGGGQNVFGENDSAVSEDKSSELNSSSRSYESSQQQPSARSTKALRLLSVCNHNTRVRISPLDIQLIYALIKASDNQLSSTESLWLPLCLTRVDSNCFMYAHISYLGEKYCLVLLSLDHGDFQRCQQAKETIQSRLNLIQSTLDPLTGGLVRSCISELNKPHLQYICHQAPRHCVMWQASIQTEFSPLNYYLIDRMQRSSFKTLLLRSHRDHCALLGWHTPTFQLYAQFDVNVTRSEALETVEAFTKWFEKEKGKLIIKDS